MCCLSCAAHTGSFWLAKPEKKKLAIGLVLFIGTFLHGTFFIACDYGLYWVMDMVRREGVLVTQEQGACVRDTIMLAMYCSISCMT